MIWLSGADSRETLKFFNNKKLGEVYYSKTHSQELHENWESAFHW